MKDKIKIKLYILPTLAVGGFFIGVLGTQFNAPPLFENLDAFVLFAEKEINFEKETQVSSGDVGSNKEITIGRNSIINGNLFVSIITLDKNTLVNGSASFNKLKTQKNTQILGSRITPVSLPIANIPNIPSFQAGTQDLTFTRQNNNLSQGNYRNITLDKNGSLVLMGGIYNISKLILKDNSTLIYSAPATLNIKEELKAQQGIAILSDQNLKLDDLLINYDGRENKKDKNNDSEDDGDDNGSNDEDVEDDNKNVKPIEFGRNSFLNFKLLAPKTTVRIGDNTILRGQVIAKKIKVGRESVISKEKTAVKIAKTEDTIIDPNGGVYPVNEILINLTPDSTFKDAVDIVSMVNGRVIGMVSSINLYQVEIPANTTPEIESILTILQNLADPRIEGVFRNFLVSVD